MKVKTFYALTMQDALRSIKEELGPDAIILSSKEVREGDRLLRVCNRPVLEVMAACEQDAAGKTQGRQEDASQSIDHQASVVPALTSRNFQSTLQSVLEPAAVPAPAVSASVPNAPSQPVAVMKRRVRLRRLRDELCEVSRQLGHSLPPETQTAGMWLPPIMARLCRSFIRQGMRPSTAEALGHDLQQRLESKGQFDEKAVKQALRQEIACRVRVGGILQNRMGHRAIGVILGPSGAGKTSMVTKLAAHYRFEQHQSVAVVTFDAYREVSVEQLRRYARALGVPFASARSVRQLHEGLRRQSRANLVLIDMPGVGPDDVSSARELHQCLQEESEMVTHVVLPANARDRDLRGILHRVKDLPSLHLLFTKLDETESCGTIFDLAHHSGVPLSYWGVGQRVPEDIEAASSDRLAEFLMAQRYVGSRGRTHDTAITFGAVCTPEAVGSVSD